MLTTSVSDVMQRDLVTLHEQENLDLAFTLMQLARIRHLPVIREEKLVGLISHRGLLHASVSPLEHLTPQQEAAFRRSILVSEVMKRDLQTVTPATTLLEAAKMMLIQKLGCLPVEQHGELVGILTEADFLRLMLESLQR